MRADGSDFRVLTWGIGVPERRFAWKFGAMGALLRARMYVSSMQCISKMRSALRA
jgi:hypothetical protein